MRAIEFENVTKRYGAVQTLNAVTFTADRGEMIGVIGPDGAGKTTAIRIACGLLRPSSGVVRVLGVDPVREHKRITGSVGYLSQRFSLYGDLSVDENIAFFAEMHHVRVTDSDTDGAIAALTSTLSEAGIGGVSIRPTVASLEDVFIDVLKRAGREHGS